MSNDAIMTVVAAVIAIIPGSAGLYVHNKAKRDRRKGEVSELGVKFAETAFQTMQAQLARLIEDQRDHDRERQHWETDRAAWIEERVALRRQLVELQEEVRMTRRYVRALSQVLGENGIEIPTPPIGWTAAA